MHMKNLGDKKQKKSTETEGKESKMTQSAKKQKNKGKNTKHGKSSGSHSESPNSVEISPDTENIENGAQSPAAITKKKRKKKKNVHGNTTLSADIKQKEENKEAPKTKKKKRKKKKTTSTVAVLDHSDDVEVTSHSKESISVTKKQMRKGKGITVTGTVIDIGDEELEALSGVGESSSPGGKKRKTSESNTDGQPPAKKKKKKKKGKQKLKAEDVVKSDEDVEAKEEEPLPDMAAWKDLFVPPEVLKALAEQRFASPMPIQSLALPSAIRDKMDIVGAAETGSGKTLAFGIPLIHHILRLKSRPAISREKEVDSSEEEFDSRDDDPEVDGEEGEASGDEDLSLGSDAEMSDGSDDEEAGEEDAEDADEMSDDGDEGVPPLGLAAMPDDGEEEEGSDVDLPPEDEQMSDLEDDAIGCVYVENNVPFDWLEKLPVDPVKLKRPRGPLYALVLTPTRELAIQVKEHIMTAAKYTGLQVACIVGGLAAQKQERLLKKSPEIVVATPGRLWELIQEGEPHLSTIEDVKFLVIDEADRMVERGHFKELTQLLEMINANEKKRNARQTFVFSATLTLIHSGPNRFMKKKKKKFATSNEKLGNLMGLVGIKEKPKVIDLSGQVGMAKALTEARIVCAQLEKDIYLYYLLNQYAGRTLVFCNTKDCVRRLISVLSLLQCNPLSLHADMHQRQRLKNLDRFKCNAKGLLLATDVAARGLDIPNVEHVIHYQVPKTSENYVHRSGRTARAYSEGLSVMLISPEEMKDYRKILHTLHRDEDLPMFPVDQDYLPGFKSRVQLAHQIDKQEHKVTKQQVQNNWFQRAAKEMDIELDEDLLLHDMGDSSEQADHKRQIQAWKFQLKNLIASPIIPARFSGKYPTKSGHLEVPYMKIAVTGGAVSAVKNEPKLKLPAPKIPRTVKVKKFKGKKNKMRGKR